MVDAAGRRVGRGCHEVLNGRFRLVREIGRGSFGAVFEAELIGPPGGTVALKVLERPSEDNAELEARFLREVKNAQRVEHPHAIGVYEFGSLTDGRLFYSMELCTGRSLQEMLDEQGPFEPARAVRLVTQALSALGALHAIGMVHRDRGIARGEKADLEGAIADDERAGALDPQLAVAWANLGSARERRGELDDALHALSRATDLDPEDARAWRLRGFVQRRRGELTSAITDLTRALELDPRDEAIADLRRFLELEPNTPRAAAARAKIDELASSA